MRGPRQAGSHETTEGQDPGTRLIPQKMDGSRLLVVAVARVWVWVCECIWRI